MNITSFFILILLSTFPILNTISKPDQDSIQKRKRPLVGDPLDVGLITVFRVVGVAYFASIKCELIGIQNSG